MSSCSRTDLRGFLGWDFGLPAPRIMDNLFNYLRSHPSLDFRRRATARLLYSTSSEVNSFRAAILCSASADPLGPWSLSFQAPVRSSRYAAASTAVLLDFDVPRTSYLAMCHPICYGMDFSL